MFWAYLRLIWTFSLIIFIRFYVYVPTYRSKIISKPVREKFCTPKLISKVTKGVIPIVQQAFNRLNTACKEINYGKCEVWVATEANEKLRNCRTIAFPVEYAYDAFYKGRACSMRLRLDANRRKE